MICTWIISFFLIIHINWYLDSYLPNKQVQSLRFTTHTHTHTFLYCSYTVQFHSVCMGARVHMWWMDSLCVIAFSGVCFYLRAPTSLWGPEILTWSLSIWPISSLGKRLHGELHRIFLWARSEVYLINFSPYSIARIQSCRHVKDKRG